MAFLVRFVRRQPERVLGELGRDGGRAAIDGESDGVVERGGDGGVRRLVREREVPRPQRAGSSTSRAMRAWTRRRSSPRSR